MFTGEITPIYFETRLGIHTFFVRHPIDVLILDKDFIVRKLKKGLVPWRLLFWNPKYFRVVEGPVGFIRNNKIKTNNKLLLYFT